MNSPYLQQSKSSISSSQSKKIKKSARQIRMGIMSSVQSPASHLSSPFKNSFNSNNQTPYNLKSQLDDSKRQQNLYLNVPTYQSRAISFNPLPSCQAQSYSFTRVQLLYPCDEDFTQKFKQLLEKHDIKIVEIVNDNEHS